MILTQQHIVRKHKYPLLWKELDELCFKTKNTYNSANYYIKQSFLANQALPKEQRQYISFNEMYHHIKTNCGYGGLAGRVFNATLRLVERNWKSYFKALKAYKKDPSKFTGFPKMPKYKDKTKGRFVAEFSNQAVSTKALKKGRIKLSGIENVDVPFDTAKGSLKMVRIVPKLNDIYSIEVVYEKPDTNLNLNKNNILSIDLGVKNIATLTSNKGGFTPELVKGGKLLSCNRFYNKRKSELQSMLPQGQSLSNRIKMLTVKRNNRVKNMLHEISNYIVKTAMENDMGRIVIGYSEQWKDGINIGRVNNQNFVCIPFLTLIEQIKYKAFHRFGIEVSIQEESYTSKASFFDFDELPVYEKGASVNYVFSGKRSGKQYKTNGGLLVNADVNGSYNILRKHLASELSLLDVLKQDKYLSPRKGSGVSVRAV